MIMALMIGSSIFSMSLGFGNFAGLSTSHDFARHARNAASARSAAVVIRFKPNSRSSRSLHDFHVQQAQEAAAKTEAQRHGIFRLVEKRRVVQLQFSERVAQRFVIIGKHRKESPRKPSA